MRLLLNLIWLVFGGLVMALGYFYHMYRNQPILRDGEPVRHRETMRSPDAAHGTGATSEAGDGRPRDQSLRVDWLAFPLLVRAVEDEDVPARQDADAAVGREREMTAVDRDLGAVLAAHLAAALDGAAGTEDDDTRGAPRTGAGEAERQPGEGGPLERLGGHGAGGGEEKGDQAERGGNSPDAGDLVGAGGSQ